jgi:hypothetical protein
VGWGLGEYYAEWILVSACFEIHVIYCKKLNNIVDSVQAAELYISWNWFVCQQNVQVVPKLRRLVWLLTVAARVRS